MSYFFVAPPLHIISIVSLFTYRVIIDEGHVLGKSANNLFQFASWLSAERLWAMTGTPTQQIATQNGLKNLFHMSNFLKHEFFSQRLGREHAWNALLSTGWRGGDFSSFFR
jgi:SNF2 family DNA or RNA helicase